jgi:hypothetical protein
MIIGKHPGPSLALSRPSPLRPGPTRDPYHGGSPTLGPYHGGSPTPGPYHGGSPTPGPYHEDGPSPAPFHGGGLTPAPYHGEGPSEAPYLREGPSEAPYHGGPSHLGLKLLGKLRPPSLLPAHEYVPSPTPSPYHSKLPVSLV